MPKVPAIKAFKNMKLRGKILSLVALLVAVIAVNAGITLWKLELIGNEIADVAEIDVPMTQAVTRFTVNQLEQGLQFERGVAQRMAELDVESSNEAYEQALTHYREYGEKAAKELEAASALATASLEIAHSAEQREKIRDIGGRLAEIAERHSSYEEHSLALLDRDGAITAERYAHLMETVHEEQDALDRDLEAILADLGRYTDRAAKQAEADEQRAVVLIASISTVGLVLGIGFGLLMAGALARPLARAVETVKALAAGDTSVELKVDSKDEVGMLAETIEIFRQTTIRANELAEAQRAEEARRVARLERQAELVRTFDTNIGTVLETVASAATEMQSTAETLTSIAEETSAQSQAVAAGSQEASANVQTVATATEELSASISEISNQVTQSSSVTQSAARQAEDADRDMTHLNESADRIGKIIELIQDIAEQTNLLALNATIEAARAGEAGKGFVIVANEVKSLATQTAKATEDITVQIGDMQTATHSVVGRIQQITATIASLQDVATTIASAVEEQTAATREIARNVEQAAAGTSEVDRNIASVSAAASETGHSAKDVLQAANQVASQADAMKMEVNSFLDGIRALEQPAAA
jgi:methyl-accepting chemotaxis protein